MLRRIVVLTCGYLIRIADIGKLFFCIAELFLSGRVCPCPSLILSLTIPPRRSWQLSVAHGRRLMPGWMDRARLPSGSNRIGWHLFGATRRKQPSRTNRRTQSRPAVERSAGKGSGLDMVRSAIMGGMRGLMRSQKEFRPAFSTWQRFHMQRPTFPLHRSSDRP